MTIIETFPDAPFVHNGHIDRSDLPILVSSAFGNLGRATVSSLIETFYVPADQIIATTRTPATIIDFAEKSSAFPTVIS